MNIFDLTKKALFESNVSKKLELTKDLFKTWKSGNFEFFEPKVIKYSLEPGRPSKPDLVLPRELQRRKLTTKDGHAAMLHAIAHIEFNAINLALDAVYRFRGMPKQYYGDWIKIAFEEGKHFELLNNYLEDLDSYYGKYPAHNGLWEMAKATSHDVLCRMALVPRIMEARGLDVTPGIKSNFQVIGDVRAVDILSVIERDEIGHVAAGNHWYGYLCKKRGLEPMQTFKNLVKQYAYKSIKGPLAIDKRKQAGFTDAEIEWLTSVIN